MQNRPENEPKSMRPYMLLILRYAWANKKLLLATILTGAIGYGAALVFPALIRSLVDHVIQNPVKGAWPPVDLDQRLHHLWILTAIGVVTAILLGVAGYGRGHFNMKLGYRIALMIREDMFDHLQKMSLQFYSKQRIGELVWRLMQEVHGVNGLINSGVILFILDVSQVGTSVFLLFTISAPLTLAVLCVLPFYIFTFKAFNSRVRSASEKVSRQFGKLTGNVTERLGAISLVKSFAAEDREREKFRAENDEHYEHIVKQSHLGHLMGALSDIWVQLGTCLVIGYGGYLAVTTNPNITAGAIMQYVGYVAILYGPLKRLADLNLVYQNSLTSIRRVFRVFEIEPEIVEKPDAIAEIPRFGAIRYESVRFHYADPSYDHSVSLDEKVPAAPEEQSCFAGHASWVLNGINFSADPGERIALVGPSGSGKTTIALLLPRLYDVIEGKVLVDDVDVRDYRIKSLRSAISIVQQDSILLGGTVRENISYGCPDATEEDIREAATAANAHGFISALPNGYDTVLGERGINLSGGQRQRVSIARALLRNPRILILDEATSALDTESEALVQQALEELMRGRTCLIIAHRLSTVRNADRILTLHHGEIVEEGTHDELLSHDGLYARLARAQFEYA